MLNMRHIRKTQWKCLRKKLVLTSGTVLWDVSFWEKGWIIRVRCYLAIIKLPDCSSASGANGFHFSTHTLCSDFKLNSDLMGFMYHLALCVFDYHWSCESIKILVRNLISSIGHCFLISFKYFFFILMYFFSLLKRKLFVFYVLTINYFCCQKHILFSMLLLVDFVYE